MDLIDWIIIFSAIVLLWLNLSNPQADYFKHVEKLLVLQVAFPIVILLVLKKNLKNYGLNLKKKKLIALFTLAFVLISIPFLIFGSRLKEFKEFYPTWPQAKESLILFLFYQLVVGLEIFATEFFYRSYLLFPFKKIGIYSIIPQAIPYLYVHLGAPALELYVSFPAGLIFGYMAYKTKSIFPSFASHWLVSAIFDVLVMI